MANEVFVIEVQDKIASTINEKLLKIADNSERANTAVSGLRTNLKALGNETSAVTKLSTAMNKTQLANEKLTQAQNKTASTAETLSQAHNKTAISAQKVTQAQLKTSVSAQKLTEQQVKTAIADKNLANASDRATAAHLRLEAAQKRLQTNSKSVGNAFSSAFGKIALAVGVTVGIREILQLGNAYVGLSNKLRVVTTDEKNLEEITNKVFDIANRTRTPVEETATAYARFDRALEPLGASQEETLRLTETINKAMIVSGSNTGEAAAGLLQLSQAFNKGKLDGDEFRTVMELMPSVADAIAKQLGVTRGELLKLAPEGKITAEVMRKALASAADEIDKKFAKTMPTLSQALTVAKNKAIQFFGEVEKNSGIMGGMATVIMNMADNMIKLAPAVSTVITSFGDLVKEVTSLSPAINGTLNVVKTSLQGIALLFALAADGIKTVKIVVMGSLGILASAASAVIAGVINDLTRLNLLTSKAGFNIIPPEAISELALLSLSMQKVGLNASNTADDIKNGTWALDNWVNSVDKANQISGIDTTLRPGKGGGSGGNTPGKEIKPKKTKSLWEFADQLIKYNTELENEAKMLSLVGDAQQIENRLAAMKVDLLTKNTVLSSEETAEYTKKFAAIIQLNRVNREQNAIWQESIGKTETFKAKLEALKNLQNAGTDQIGFSVAKTTLFGDMFDGTQEDSDTALKQHKDFYDQVEQLRNANLISEKTAKKLLANEDLKYFTKRSEAASNFFNTVAQLQSSGNRRLFEIGKAAAIAQATIDGYAAVTKAMSQGGFFGFAMAAAVAAATGSNIANIAQTKMQGYEKGGLITGGQQVIKVNEKGTEFVSNAAATAKNRPYLEAMNNGADGKSLFGQKISVNIQNYGTSKEFEVEQDDGNIRIIARDEAKKAVRNETPGLVASEIANPNSSISKSLSQNTMTTRKR